MKINVEIDRIRIEVEGGAVIHLTREGARDLQEQLDDFLGPVEAEFGPFTVIADPYTFTWDTGTPFNSINT